VSAIAFSTSAMLVIRHLEASPNMLASRCSFRAAAGLRRARRSAAMRWRASSRFIAAKLLLFTRSGYHNGRRRKVVERGVVGRLFEPAGSPDFPVRGVFAVASVKVVRHLREEERAIGKSPAPAGGNACPTQPPHSEMSVMELCSDCGRSRRTIPFTRRHSPYAAAIAGMAKPLACLALTLGACDPTNNK